MNILILTGKFGTGHLAAAHSLRQQLLRCFSEAAVDVVDFLAYAMPKLSKAMYKGFHLMVFHGSPIFNTYYKFTSMGRTDARPPMESLLFNRLSELLCEKSRTWCLQPILFARSLYRVLRKKQEAVCRLLLVLPM